MDAQGVPITGDTDWSNPRWNYPEYLPGSVVEIRVHGVGGEPPSGMTRDPNPRNVGGDALAGFWRARNPVVGELPSGRQHVREVLAWGGQTSGTTRHAFWVTLLPFALFNLAGRMGPSKEGGRARAYRSVARVLAYTMTLSVVALTSATAFDLLGRQVAARDVGGFLGPVLRYFEMPAERMGFVALFPAAVLVLLWLAGKYKSPNLEGYGEDGTSATTEPVSLDDSNFWRNAWSTSRLRATHATGGFALLGGMLALVLGDVGPEDQRWIWQVPLGFSIAVVVGCGIVAGLSRTARPGRSRRLHNVQWILRLVALGTVVPGVVIALGGHVPNFNPAAAWLLRIMGSFAIGFWIIGELRLAGDQTKARPNTRISRNLLIVLGIAALVSSFPSAAEGLIGQESFGTELGVLPASMEWLPSLFQDALMGFAPHLYLPAYALLLPLVVAQALLLAVLLACGLETQLPPERTGSNQPGRAFPLNTGGVVVALLALLVITAVGGSLHALTIDVLGRRVSSPANGFILPWWYALTAWVAAFGLPLTLIISFVVRLIVRKLVGSTKVVPPEDEEIVKDLNRGLDGPGQLATGARLKKLRSQWMFQRLLRDGGWMITTAVSLATAGVIAQLVRTAASKKVGVETELPLTSAAIWAVTALAGLAIAFVRSTLKNKERQRKVGVIWDVANFWPRVTHPFAPPCYGEAIVPMLDKRITDLTELTDRRYRVVLAGHSQGSVLSLATAVRHEKAKADLVTYGSPIVILFERFFPLVFGGDDGAIARAEKRTQSWHHLFGMSEPFAMPFWNVPGASDEERRKGWSASIRVPHADAPCPVCGWLREPPPYAPGKALHTDFVVSDPSRWKVPLDPVDPPPKGHSTYHDNREVDLHIARIAEIAARGT